MKMGIKFIKANIEEIMAQSKAADENRKNAADRQRAFIESCKRNSSVQQRIDRSRGTIQSKRPSEK